MKTPDSLELPPRPASPPFRWRRGWRARRALIQDPDDTAQAIDLANALGQGDFERTLRRVAATPNGRRLLLERPSLAAALSDRDALEALPAGSLGRGYLDYLARTGFQPLGLVELSARVQTRWESAGEAPPIDSLRAWFRDRSLLVHDLTHVVMGYGTDDVGEATLLGFTLAQEGGRAQRLLTYGAYVEMLRNLGWPWVVHAYRAWRRGARALQLVALPWEELLPMRLDTVRELVRVGAPEQAHPGGVLSGRFRGSAHASA
jgi:ubiquinone biosynthesis protein COQ4